MPRSVAVLLTAVAVGALTLAACAKRAPMMTPEPVLAPSVRNVLPLPLRSEPAPGQGFHLTGDTVIVIPPGDARARWIAQQLAALIGIAAAEEPLKIEEAAGPRANAVRLQVGGAPAEGAEGEEGYVLTIAPEGVTIAANHHAGLFYGVQSFRQILPPFLEHQAARFDKARPVTAPAGRIVDAPRYGWRGAMLDVSRHFFGLDDVKRYIDLMALYKLNRLHLHLSDDQGWRIEITSWPNLTAHGGSTQVGGGPGGYYTQDQYAEIVRYAAERFIIVVPEIDMPGHTNAALASYAELNCDGKARELYTGIRVGFSALCVEADVTYRFIDDVVREIAALTPGPWFHIGGDEVKELTPAQYDAFIERVQGIVRMHGKQVIGWDEIASATLQPDTLVQVWRPKTAMGPAIERGAKVIMSIASRAYLDMKYDAATPIGLTWAGRIDVPDAYDWDPAAIVPGLDPSAIVGVEAPLWSETIATIGDIEFLAFPRLIAIAEVGWTPQEQRRWDDFRQRLVAHTPRLTALGVNFYRSPAVW
jgi:hexosaminidase